LTLNNVIVAKEFQAQREALIEAALNFDQSLAPIIGTGDRNVIKRIEIDGISMAVKSFKRPNWINRLVYRYWRKSKAHRSYIYAHKLVSLGIGTPQPIAFMETYGCGGIQRSYYFSLNIEADYTFRDLIHQPDLADRDHLIEAFTKFTFNLHQKGVLFQDHSPGNTLIQINGNTPKFYLVDLNRMTFKNLSKSERIQNFARLTPLKEMVDKMSETYARLTGWPVDELKRQMWRVTEDFQNRFHRKRRLKKQLFFWRK
jgi:hypothetical protein